MNHHIRRSMLSVKVLLFLCIDFSSSWLELAFPSGTQLPSDTVKHLCNMVCRIIHHFCLDLITQSPIGSQQSNCNFQKKPRLTEDVAVERNNSLE